MIFFTRCHHKEAVFFQSQSSKADVSLSHKEAFVPLNTIYTYNAFDWFKSYINKWLQSFYFAKTYRALNRKFSIIKTNFSKKKVSSSLFLLNVVWKSETKKEKLVFRSKQLKRSVGVFWLFLSKRERFRPTHSSISSTTEVVLNLKQLNVNQPI